jgi:hypothetical protein
MTSVMPLAGLSDDGRVAAGTASFTSGEKPDDEPLMWICE